MGRDQQSEDMRTTVLLMQEEIDRLSSPPYVSGTVLEIGKKTARISVKDQGIYEIPAIDAKKAKVKRGSRVILHPTTKALLGNSEFDELIGEVATVDEVLGNRLRVQSKGEQYIVLSSLEGVKTGDEVVLDPSRAMALERFSRKRTKYALEEVPTAPWSNIGGLEDILDKIRREVEDPFKHREIFARYGRKPIKGVLLYGPPGCGKTMIGKSIAYNLSQISGNGKADSKGHFIRINGPEILDKWVGNSEATIRRIYEAARETASENGSPVVVFIDEAEAVLKTRGSGISTDVYDSIVPQFLAEMDGLNGHSNIITVLATNREDIIDPAILRDGRVDRRIKVHRPTQNGAAEIFQIYLTGKPFQKGSNNPRELATKLASDIYDCDNFVYSVVHPNQGVLGKFLYRHLVSGAMIKGIVDRASSYAIQREINKGSKGISRVDLDLAVKDELAEQVGFTQALVRDDWENVFGAEGAQYQRAHMQGYLVLESNLKNGSHSTKSKGGKTK